MPCVDVLPEAAEWSCVMQVKYKLQAVVTNCDIICTLNFLVVFFFFSLICCGGSQHRKLLTVVMLFLFSFSVCGCEAGAGRCVFNHGCDR